MSDFSSVLDTYLPFLPVKAWREMRETVLSLTRPYALEHSEASTRQALSVLTGYAHWAREQGLINSPDDPRAASFIDLYLQHRTTQIRPQGAAREAAILRELFGTGKVERRTAAPPRLSDVPYTNDEVTQIRAWAAYAPSVRNRLDRTAIAALALGCGLTASEMMAARTDDLTILDSDDLDVTVRGPRRRTVPALQAWAPLLADLRTTADEAEWLIAPGRRDRGGQTLNSVRHELKGDICPVPRRMRNTWLVTQVNGGTPPSVTMNAAGLLDADFLRRLAPYIDLPTVDEQRALLRNGGSYA
jgi:integrase